MSEPVFDVAFYGIVQAGKDKDTVIENMATLFKTTPEKIRPYFAGGRKVIKSRVDELTAEKYRVALDNIGLVMRIEQVEIPAGAETETDAEAEPRQTADSGSDDGPGIAPVGADLQDNPPVVEAQPIGDISAITMAEVGADVLENPPQVTPQPIGDISAITMAEVGADVLENPTRVEAQPIGDISGITMAEVGADVIANPKPVDAAPLPDTSNLSVEDR